MPIANCIVAADCTATGDSLVELWSSASGQAAEHMTVNIVTSTSQFGNRYKVMVTLVLPSIWPRKDISALQKGLASALARFYNLPDREIHVVTTVVDSGMVVEDGQEIQW